MIGKNNKSKLFISINFVFNCLMESEIGEANTQIFIFGLCENLLMGISW